MSNLFPIPDWLQDRLYVDLKGRYYWLPDLDDEERALFDQLRQVAANCSDSSEYRNASIRLVGDFYAARGLDRKATTETTLWKISQDISGRLHIAEGWSRAPDYRDELSALVDKRFGTRRAFCEATGIAEDMLSHVLSGRKDFSLATLSDALAKIGYGLHIAPVPSALE